MADYIPAEIHIGGPIPRALLDTLIKEIVTTGASILDYGEKCATEEDVRDRLQAGKVFDLYDDRARYGRFDELEDFLVREGIHFDLHYDAKSEHDSQNLYYRGGQRVLELNATQNGKVLIPQDDIMKILSNPQTTDKNKLNDLMKLAAPPEMKPLEPVRFI